MVVGLPEAVLDAETLVVRCAGSAPEAKPVSDPRPHEPDVAVDLGELDVRVLAQPREDRVAVCGRDGGGGGA